jgi:predicted nucleic acid-binding protein
MSDDFFDSSVILYLFDPTDDTKRSRARALIDEALVSHDSSISFQVVQEVLNVIIHKFSRAASSEDARLALETILMPLWRVMPSRQLYRRALELQPRYGYRFYDSLIIAAALEDGCTRLLSEDLQHGQRIEGLAITNPFIATGDQHSGSNR